MRTAAIWIALAIVCLVLLVTTHDTVWTVLCFCCVILAHIARLQWTLDRMEDSQR